MTADKFRKMRQRLADEVRAASMHYQLYVDLRAALNADAGPFNRAPNFWSLTLNAHLESVRMALPRVYDQHQDALGLPHFLRFVQCHSRIFESPIEEAELNDAMASVRSRDPLIKKLVLQRSSAFAHISAKGILGNAATVKKFPLTFTEFETLISRAQHLLNRHSIAFDGLQFAWLTPQREDFKQVLLRR